MIKCCFCGKDIKDYGNDPRPIKVANEVHPICCDECNAKIVIPTREEIWHVDSENAVLKEEKEMLKKQIAEFKQLFCPDPKDLEEIPSMIHVNKAQLTYHSMWNKLKQWIAERDVGSTINTTRLMLKIKELENIKFDIYKIEGVYEKENTKKQV